MIYVIFIIRANIIRHLNKMCYMYLELSSSDRRPSDRRIHVSLSYRIFPKSPLLSIVIVFDYVDNILIYIAIDFVWFEIWPKKVNNF